MIGSTARPIACILAISAFVACASNQQYESSSAAGTVDLSAYPNPPLDTAELQLLRGMSDADILGHFITVDSMEVATADTALRLSKNDDVITYARLMKATHSANLRQDKAIAEQAGITPIRAFGGIRASHVAASLDSLTAVSDMRLDRYYIMSQVELHQHVLAELETLQGAAKNDAVREHVATMIPVVRDHLARAHAIAVARGYEKKRA